MATSGQMEARSSDRKRVLKGAKILFANRHSTIPCVVRDLSSVGARLQIKDQRLVPDTFELFVELDGFEAHAEVIWRRDGEVGVEFVGNAITRKPTRAQIVTCSDTTRKTSLRRKAQPKRRGVAPQLMECPTEPQCSDAQQVGLAHTPGAPADQEVPQEAAEVRTPPVTDREDTAQEHAADPAGWRAEVPMFRDQVAVASNTSPAEQGIGADELQDVVARQLENFAPNTSGDRSEADAMAHDAASAIEGVSGVAAAEDKTVSGDDVIPGSQTPYHVSVCGKAVQLDAGVSGLDRIEITDEVIRVSPPDMTTTSTAVPTDEQCVITRSAGDVPTPVLREEQPPRVETACFVEDAKETDAVNGRAIPILIAEDDPDDRMFMREAFAESDFTHNIDFVENGEELLAYLKGENEYAARPRPELILLDLNMPKMDGRSALKQIKSNPDTRRIPVIVLTTSQSDDDIEKTYDLGVNSYITKPSSTAGLKEVITTLNAYWSSVCALPHFR